VLLSRSGDRSAHSAMTFPWQGAPLSRVAMSPRSFRSMVRRQEADPLQQGSDGILLRLWLPLGIAVDGALGRRRRRVFGRRRSDGTFCKRRRIDGYRRYGRDLYRLGRDLNWYRRNLSRQGRDLNRRGRNLSRRCGRGLFRSRSALRKGACGLRPGNRCFRCRRWQANCRRGLLSPAVGHNRLSGWARCLVVRRQHRIEGGAKGQRRQQQRAGAYAKLCPVGLLGRMRPHRSNSPGR
jgi:hypothetical protein